MSANEFILDTFVWSFSRLNGFDTCPYEWHQNYIECADKENNAYAEAGLSMHKTLEAYAKGEIDIFDLNDYYSKQFADEVVHDFPKIGYVDQKQAQFDEAMDYLSNINLDFDKYEILGVEKQVNFVISGKPFIGFIDLLLRDKLTGEIIILDHKSAKIKFLKSGKISKTDEQHFLEFRRQLYLYSKAIIEEYGRVDKLMWNLFRIQRLLEIPWDEEEYNEAIQWADETINRIYVEEEFAAKPDNFYCNNLCNQRYNCSESSCVHKSYNAEHEYAGDGWEQV